MMPPRSISLKLTCWFSSVVLGGLLFFGAAMWLELDHTVTAGRSLTLVKRADRLRELLNRTEPDSPAERDAKFHAFAIATGGGLVAVFQANGSCAYPPPSSSAKDFPWPHFSDLQGDRFSKVDFAGQQYLVLSRPYSSASQSLVLSVAATLEGNRVILSTFTMGLVWTLPVLLIVSVVGGYLLSRRALRPVGRIIEATRSISASNLSQRLPVIETHDELQKLSETCNAMLTRLESALNEIKRFTADASHELRNPISFMRTVAQVALRNPPADEASRRAFEEIVEESRKASRLLEDMLTLARADSGDASLDFEEIDLAEVVSDVCHRARMQAAERQHSLTVSFAEARGTLIWGDYSSLQRLLWILVENAIKYTPSPGRIHISLSVTSEGASIAVKDSGVGIAEADMARIFERFYRADPSRSLVAGAGLGLAIAKWIAQTHHARILVESQENAGSVFRVEFPLSFASERVPTIASSASRLTSKG